MTIDRHSLDTALAELQPRVRAAHSGDAHVVSRLLGDLAALEWSGPVTAAMPGNVLSFLSGESSSVILVVEESYRVAGFAAVHLYPGIAEGAPAMFLDDIYVDEPLQRRGLGSALMAGVFRAAEHLGACHVWLQSRATNHNAHKFFERYGFILQKDIVYERILDNNA